MKDDKVGLSMSAKRKVLELRCDCKKTGHSEGCSDEESLLSFQITLVEFLRFAQNDTGLSPKFKSDTIC